MGVLRGRNEEKKMGICWREIRASVKVEGIGYTVVDGLRVARFLCMMRVCGRDYCCGSLINIGTWTFQILQELREKFLWICRYLSDG